MMYALVLISKGTNGMRCVFCTCPIGGTIISCPIVSCPIGCTIIYYGIEYYDDINKAFRAADSYNRREEYGRCNCKVEVREIEE